MKQKIMITAVAFVAALTITFGLAGKAQAAGTITVWTGNAQIFAFSQTGCHNTSLYGDPTIRFVQSVGTFSWEIYFNNDCTGTPLASGAGTGAHTFDPHIPGQSIRIFYP